jgi:hypothetical protein
MKILVDEMPFFQTDCVFYDGCDCKLDDCYCEYMGDHEARYRYDHLEKCRWLTTIDRIGYDE